MQRGEHSLQSALQRRAKQSQKNSSTAAGQIFLTSRPRHIASGLASGVWNVVKGVGLGAASLIAAPVAGACDDGWKGFGKGVGQGLVAAVSLPIAGVVTGVSQVGQGCVNTFDGWSESKRDKVWDEKEGAWVDKYGKLDEEYEKCKQAYEEYQAERARKSPSGSRMIGLDSHSRQVADTEYYDLLQVPADATQGEIREAYYKLARESRPDQQKDDPGGAEENFQAVGEAYQVLGDKPRRDQYDKHGKSATEAMDFVDSSVFFAMLFGSESMEPYIGKLRLSSVMGAMDAGTEGEGEGDMVSAVVGDTREQEYRQCQLAVQLRDRLQPGVIGLMNEADRSAYVEWKAQQRQIADGLCKESFGAEHVDAVGFVYENYADQYIGKQDIFKLGATKAKYLLSKRQTGTYVSAILAAQSVASTNSAAKKAARKWEKAAKAGSAPTAEGEMSLEEVEAMEKSLANIMKTMLQLCIADLNATVRAAAIKTLNDQGVNEEQRRCRADALRDLGKIFQEAAKAHEDVNVPVDAREQMQDVAAVALPMARLATGVSQVGQGCVDTSDGWSDSKRDRVWDEKKKAWVFKYTEHDEEYEKCKQAYGEYQAERAKKSPSGSEMNRRDSHSRQVADTEYYELLQVPTDATQGEIRKAYYKLARECHPDKQIDDPGAEENFQAVGEAYQVLGDKPRRDQYDKHGKSATEAMDFVDSSVFFAMLFGSESMEPYIGKLRLSSVMDAGTEGEGDMVSAVVGDTREQEYRQCQLAVQLRDRLQPGVIALMNRGGRNAYVEWKAQQRQIADGLCKESFGAELVDAVGFVYENYADQHIAKKDTLCELGAKKAWLQQQTRQMGTLFSVMLAAQSFASTNSAAGEAARKRNKAATTEGGMSPEEVEAMEKSLVKIVKTVLQLCIADLNATVRAAARKTLNDQGVNEEQRRCRADALRDLGKIFQETAEAHKLSVCPWTICQRHRRKGCL